MRRPALALLCCAASALADETLPVPAAAPAVHALFAVEGTLAIPLACYAGGRPVERYRCRDRIPDGATVRLGDGSAAKVVARAGASCGGEVDPFPSLRLDRAARGAGYALYPASLKPSWLLAPEVGRYHGEPIWRYPVVRPYGDSATDTLVVQRWYAKTRVFWEEDGGSPPKLNESYLAYRDDSRPIRVLAAPDLDGDGQVELLLNVPGRKTWLMRRGARGWEDAGGWGCRD